MKNNIKLDKIDAGENYDEHPQDDDIEEIGSKVTQLCNDFEILWDFHFTIQSFCNYW